MPHVITDDCVKCKYTDCVDICPAMCFFEGEDMLVIDPETCIDCELCIPKCPVDAIKRDIDIDNIYERLKWLERNAKYAEQWPNITRSKPAPPDADDWRGMPNKFEKFVEGKKKAR